MITRSPAFFALLAVLTLSSGGCNWFRRTPAPKPPPTPAPAPAPATSTPEPVPPAPAPSAPAPSPTPAAPQPSTPAPAVHPPKPKSEPAPVVATPPPPPPALGQILTPQQQAEFRRSYQQSAQFARQTLSRLSGRTLSRDQAETATRIRSFLSQADEAQSRDPAVAAQLARRAELLARDLLNSFP